MSRIIQVQFKYWCGTWGQLMEDSREWGENNLHLPELCSRPFRHTTSRPCESQTVN
ncbi:hypothetical protein KIN20_025276 [Parelaphostrongylus tenuis]|uniref:Uncharacterized protein n=1 Tax=Parelaphostrongylus tenuis TaxID=148309 RepID=A0AAD5MUZ1_PARTN|nr:hypothetical protein KIN20_025276 [Parelaphostrongylus tenuis]